MRAPGYEPLEFDVRITPEQTTTYQGELNEADSVNRRFALIAAVSGIYDAFVGVTMLAGRPLLAQLFGVPLPEPPIHADLNGIFLLAVAAGYLIPYRDPDSAGGRAYLWVMGPLLKGAGALDVRRSTTSCAARRRRSAVRGQRRRAGAGDAVGPDASAALGSGLVGRGAACASIS